MFGMLDYRAHKLAVLLFGLPMFVLTWLTILGTPIMSYALAYSYIDTPLLRFIGGFFIQFVLEIIVVSGLLWLIGELFKKIFKMIVDIIPHDGRTTDEAEYVAWGGEKAIILLEANKHPSKWRRDIVLDLPKTDWVQNLFYRKKVIRRINFLISRYEELGKDYPHHRRIVEELLDKGGIKPPDFIEEWVCNKKYRSMTYTYLILFYCLLSNPFRI